MIVLAQLHHRERALAGARIDEADRAHRPKRQRVAPAPRHLLDRHAALEVDAALEVLGRHLLGREHHRVDEAVVLVARQRAVEIVVAALAVARRREGDAMSIESAVTIGAMAS